MFPFNYERVERPDEGVCVYHSVTLWKQFAGFKRGEYFTKIKHKVDAHLLEFYEFDKIIRTFSLKGIYENHSVWA